MQFKIERLKHWYLLAMTGTLLIIIGFSVFFTPITSFLTIARIVSVGFIIAGISEVLFSFSNGSNLNNLLWNVVGGAVTLVFGLLLILRPDMTAVVLNFHVGLWLLLRSVVQVLGFHELNKIGARNLGWVLAFGILGIIMAFVILLNPMITSVVGSYWMGLGLFTFGVIQFMLAFGLRSIGTEMV